MRFLDTPLAGSRLILPEPREDERGGFVRTYCATEFAEAGLGAFRPLQCSISSNRVRGTLRGMHWQREPHAETKLVTCIRGAIYDVIVDLRPESATYCRWYGTQLDPHNRAALYIPGGFAHGFVSLEDNSEVSYAISEYYHPELSAAARWDDPRFGIAWPLQPVIMSDRDRLLPDFQPGASGSGS